MQKFSIPNLKSINFMGTALKQVNVLGVVGDQLPLVSCYVNSFWYPLTVTSQLFPRACYRLYMKEQKLCENLSILRSPSSNLKGTTDSRDL